MPKQNRPLGEKEPAMPAGNRSGPKEAGVKTRLLTASVLLVLATQGVRAQDARTVLQAVSQNIGADNLTTLQISGTKGWSAAPGASYSTSDDWTRFEVVSYQKQLDYNARFSHEQLARQWGSYSRLGGGQGVPDQGQQHIDFVLNGNTAWIISGGGAGPYDREGYMDGIPVAEMWQLDMIMTPPGFVKAALATGANPAVVTTGPRGHRLSYVSIVALGKYHVTAAINERNEIESVTTHVANPMFGDMLYDWTYGPYKQFGAVKYPSLIHHDEGDVRLNPAHNAMEIQISDVRANGPVQVFTPTGAEKLPGESMEKVESQKLAEGIWYVGGIRHASVAVEFRDFMTVIDAPLDEKRAIAVIDEVHRLAPDKPIRYLVNTHHHFDHAGGLRTYVAEGATVVTNRANQEFYEKVVFSPAPRALEPDRLSLLNPDQLPKPVMELVGGKYVISDGKRSLEVYSLPPSEHTAEMLIAYLPNEKMVINADIYEPPQKGARPPRPNEGMRVLLETVQKLGLDVSWDVGLHSGVGPHDDLVKIVGQAAGN
jgi:glyoxylase-like metal-dependent hydrolase (beta-lactamase superfamily II)